MRDIDKKKYCGECGRTLIIKKTHVGYDERTGEKTYRYRAICSNKSFLNLKGHSDYEFYNDDSMVRTESIV